MGSNFFLSIRSCVQNPYAEFQGCKLWQFIPCTKYTIFRKGMYIICLRVYIDRLEKNSYSNKEIGCYLHNFNH